MTRTKIKCGRFEGDMQKALVKYNTGFIRTSYREIVPGIPHEVYVLFNENPAYMFSISRSNSPKVNYSTAANLISDSPDLNERLFADFEKKTGMKLKEAEPNELSIPLELTFSIIKDMMIKYPRNFRKMLFDIVGH